MSKHRQTARDAVFLVDEPIGVDREKDTRTISLNGDSLGTSLNPVWLRQLGIDCTGAQVYHSLSLAQTPIIITEPAIIVQPAKVIQND